MDTLKDKLNGQKGYFKDGCWHVQLKMPLRDKWKFFQSKHKIKSCLWIELYSFYLIIYPKSDSDISDLDLREWSLEMEPVINFLNPATWLPVLLQVVSGVLKWCAEKLFSPFDAGSTYRLNGGPKYRKYAGIEIDDNGNLIDVKTLNKKLMNQRKSNQN